MLTWQALNPVDDDLDGFADTFPSARRVGLDREFAGGALPAAGAVAAVGGGALWYGCP